MASVGCALRDEELLNTKKNSASTPLLRGLKNTYRK